MCLCVCQLGEDSWVGRSVRKLFNGYGNFYGTVTDVEVQDERTGQRQFFVEYEDGDSEHLWPRELQRILLPATETIASASTTQTIASVSASVSATTSSQTAAPAAAPARKKKKHCRLSNPSTTVLFFLDCETTGSRRNYDRAIEWAIIAYDMKGRRLGEFVTRVNPNGVEVSPAAYNIHGISDRDVARAPQFKQVAEKMNAFFARHLEGMSCGAFVAHNASTDLQFLICEHIRIDASINCKIKYGLCTYQTVKRLKTVYKTADPADWTATTATGNRSYSVKCCAEYALSKRNPPGLFEVECGRHHEALADVKAIATFFLTTQCLTKKGCGMQCSRINARHVGLNCRTSNH